MFVLFSKDAVDECTHADFNKDIVNHIYIEASNLSEAGKKFEVWAGWADMVDSKWDYAIRTFNWNGEDFYSGQEFKSLEDVLKDVVIHKDYSHMDLRNIFLYDNEAFRNHLKYWFDRENFSDRFIELATSPFRVITKDGTVYAVEKDEEGSPKLTPIPYDTL